MTLMFLDNNRYRIIRHLGGGGFGDTFLAEDTQMPSGRHCVIKQLKPVINNNQIYQLVQERFRREAAILEELGESNNQIPRLYAYFTEAEQFYLVQEWVQGETITQRVQQQGALSEVIVKQTLVNILPVLDYIHSKRIVHRDIKPDNIIIRLRDNLPVLIDFGAVKETMGTVVASGGNTNSSIVIGTPGFMPAEQSAGRPLYASDLYSLGLTAIYMLTGKMPKDLETDYSTGEIIWHHHAFHISPMIMAVLDKAIQPYPRDRYHSATEMLNALEGGSYAAVPTVVPPTELPPPIVVSSPSPQPEISYQPPTVVPPTSKTGDWPKAVIIGGLIGGSVLAGLVLTQKFRPSSPTVAISPSPTPVKTSPNINPTSTSTSTSISKAEATKLIDRWLQGKREIFAPPFNRDLVAELTTGEEYESVAGPDGSISWLENNNAYYQYGEIRIDDVYQFQSDGDRASIQVKVTEDRTLYRNEKIDPTQTDFKPRIITYNLQFVGDRWKIASKSAAN